jgi:transcriptional regulator with GAF, ATPase, and Fis domain
MQRAVEHGALASLSVPLPISEGIGGALNIYARQPDVFDDDSRSVATRFAPYAAVAASNMYAYEDARDMAENYQRALESWAVIDQAKGILMERYKLPADMAFQAIARVSMQTNTKVRDVADTLVRTGVFPLG